MGYKPPTKNEKRIADETNTIGPGNCIAQGCPNPWTVERDGVRACSAHAYAEWRDWPRITQHLIERRDDRARAAPRQRPAPISRDEAQQQLHNLAGRMRGAGSRAWAERLRDREQAGRRLTEFQKRAWRAALPERAPPLPDEVNP